MRKIEEKYCERGIHAGILVLLTILLLSGTAEAWWNTSYYRTPIRLNNTGNVALTFYQVPLTVSYNSTVMDVNFTTFHVVNETSGLEEPFWIESQVNSSYAKIWMNLSNIPGLAWTNITYYLYFRNATENSASNGTNTFELFDDFSDNDLDASKWTKTESYGITVSETGSELKVSGTSTGVGADNGQMGYVTSVPVFSNVSFDGRMKNAAGDAGSGILQFWKAAGSYSTYGYFDNWGGVGNYLGYYNYNSWYNGDAFDSGNDGAYHEYSFRRIETSLELWRDGIQRTTKTNTNLSTGDINVLLAAFGRLAGDTVDARFDNIRVRKYTSPEPNVLNMGARPNNTIETINNIPVTNINGNTSATILTLNASYVIKFSGAWTYGAGITQDALYKITPSVVYYRHDVSPYISVAAGKFTGRTVSQYIYAGDDGAGNPSASSSRRIDPDTGLIIAGTYDTSNTYYFSYTGEGAVINIYLVDHSGSDAYYDNSGSFTAIIYDVVSFDYESPPEVSTVTISCLIGWCYAASNYSSITLLQLDNNFSTDTIQGRYNATSQKYESHRTNYSFNQNVSVAQKEGYYIYFSAAQDIITTPGNTPSITLKTGWNLVANYGSSARTLSALKSSIGVSATQAKYYDKTLKTWVSTDSQSVPAMESFFVYVTSQTDWSN